MNVKEYISSGVIEAFVYDQLNDQERQEVLSLAQKYPEVQEAINDAEETLQAFAMKGSIQPPASAKKAILDDIIGTTQEEKESHTEDSSSDEKEEAPVRQMRKSSGAYPYLTAAASIVAAVGIVMSLYYRNQWMDTKGELNNLLAQNEALAQQYNIVKNQARQYASNLEVLRQPGIETVAMEGLEIAPGATALVHWNKQTNEAYLDAKKMPSIGDQSKQYQLWAIVNGQPVDMGVFDVEGDLTSLLKMKNIENPSAFAVTLEPRGGSENPTMEQMYVIGKLDSNA